MESKGTGGGRSSSTMMMTIRQALSALFDSSQRVFIVSFPHILVVSLFLAYAYMGAAILAEIEHSPSGTHSEHVLNSKRMDRLVDKLKTDILNKLEVKYSVLIDSNQENDRLSGSASIHSQFQTFMARKEASSRKYLMNGDAKTDENKRIDLEALRYMRKLHKNANKSASFNATVFFKAIALYLGDYKENIQSNMSQNVNEFLNEYKKRNWLALKHVVDDVKVDHLNKLDSVDEKEEPARANFFAFFFYVVTQLTTIGSQETRAQSSMSKIFLIAYLLFGIPLAQICLADLGRLFVHTLKFITSFLQLIQQNSATLYSSLKKKAKKPDEKDKSSESSSENVRIVEDSIDSPPQSFLDTLSSINQQALDQVDSRFDFSNIFLCTFILVYILVGCLFYLHNHHFSWIDNIYSCFSMLLTIIHDKSYKLDDDDDDDDDEEIDEKSWLSNRSKESEFKHWSNLLFVLHLVYVLIGVAFFHLIIRSMKEKLRLCLVENLKKLTAQFLTFLSQFRSDQSELSDENIEQLLDGYFDTLGLSEPHESGPALSSNKFDLRKESIKKYSMDDDDVEFMDKQTQVTTILYSRQKLDNNLLKPSMLGSGQTSSRGVGGGLSTLNLLISNAVSTEELNFDENTTKPIIGQLARPSNLKSLSTSSLDQSSEVDQDSSKVKLAPSTPNPTRRNRFN